MVERQIGKLLKYLRTDNGSEYTSNEFKKYCAQHGIRNEKTEPSTPQHNGADHYGESLKYAEDG